MKKIIVLLLSVLVSMLCYGQDKRVSANAHLRGRIVVGSIPLPAAVTSSTSGVVVVTIHVDRYGTVTEAIPGAEGTTITEKEIWAAARTASLKVHFNQSASAPSEQTGTITYVYVLRADSEISEYTPIKDIVKYLDRGEFCIRAAFVETINESELLFTVEDEDYIIPIRLVKNDLGAVKRFRALNLHCGDSLVIRGRLTPIEVRRDFYKGLADAEIMDKKGCEANDSSHLNYGHVREASEPVKYQLIEVKPSFNGGDANTFSKWVNENLSFPEGSNVSGRVILEFTIKADGRVTDVHVIQGVRDDIDAEAVRVISQSPRWKPGRRGGEAVDVLYTFPVIVQTK